MPDSYKFIEYKMAVLHAHHGSSFIVKPFRS